MAWVPGGFEIPMAARRFAKTGRYAAVIWLCGQVSWCGGG